MQMLMLWSHTFKEARYERGVTYTGLNQAYFFFGFPTPIQVGLRDRKTFFSLTDLYIQFMPLSYSAPLKTTLAVQMLAVFGAPISIQLGQSVHNPREEQERADPNQALSGPLLFKIQSLQIASTSAQTLDAT